MIDKAKNRPILADGAGNANFQVMFLPTSLNVNTLKPGTKPNGDELLFTNNNYATNPYVATSKFINNTRRNRLIASTSMRYTFDNGLFIQGRIGRDYYYDRFTGVIPNGTGYYAQAFRNITEQFNGVSELNADVMVGKTFKVNTDFSVSVNAGCQCNESKIERNSRRWYRFCCALCIRSSMRKTKQLIILISVRKCNLFMEQLN